MTPLDKLKAAEAKWLDDSEEQEFFFELFEKPMQLRRSKSVPGAFAALKFGTYEALDGQWMDNQRAVWLSMIVSNKPGSGGILLNAIGRDFVRLGLALVGTPTALKPRDWDKSRPFNFREETLICWYLRHGFKVIQSGSQTRVVRSPTSGMLKSSFELVT
jgi:hypothetical protein